EGIYHKQREIYYATQQLLDIFQFPVVYGGLSEAITQPNAVVLSESAAKRIFGDTDPVGENIKLDGWATMKVAAVYRDVPDNSHFHPEMLISMENDRQNNLIWLSNNYY